jgi:hypothetical protein
MEAATVQRNVSTIAANFAEERRERQQRRNLVASDFDRLRDAGFLCLPEFRLATVAYGKAYRGPPAQFVRCFAFLRTAIPRLPWFAPCIRQC